MFSGLRENAPIFILTKGERPVLQVGTVVSVSNPNIGFGAQMPMLNPGAIMEVTVKVGDNTFDLKSLPCNQSSHVYAKENAFVTDNWQEMLKEVDNLERASQAVVDSAPLHADLVKSYKSMKEVLDPQIAKERANQEQIDDLKSRMGGIEDTLGQMMGLLQSLNTGGGSKKVKE